MNQSFEFVAGNLALDFANTVHIHGAEDPRDDLPEFSDLAMWAFAAGLLEQAEYQELVRFAGAEPETAKEQLRRAVNLRERIYRLFSGIAVTGKSDNGDLAGFNRVLADVFTGFAVAGTGRGYQLRWNRAQDTGARVLQQITQAAVELLTSHRLARVRQCDGETCTWMFVDTSRNGTRRWCDMAACGNRSKVRRFRLRGAAPGQTG